MTHRSDPGLLVLHAVRLLGFAEAGAVADRAGVPEEETRIHLRRASSAGWVEHVGFADLTGWSLSERGRAENERQLAAERETADPGETILAVHRGFLPLNARLVRAVTDWQIMPTAGDSLAVNDHADVDGDARVLAELAAIAVELEPLEEKLTAVLARFSGYRCRFGRALALAAQGRVEFVDAMAVDSCHRVWFQLHEDLIATLGIDRRSGG